jgi:dipeptidyl aminopeptidase/acylaminoacyl peptidase
VVAKTKRTLKPEDSYLFRSVSDPQLSPDGAWVACVVGWSDREKDRFFSDLWLFSTDGKHKVQLTNRHHRDHTPRWSPDGTKLAFVSPESEEEEAKSQLWVIPIGGGEAVMVTDLKQGAGSPAWSPDGKRLAFIARDEKPEDREERKTKFEVKKGRVYATDVKVVDELRWRTNMLAPKGERRHIWAIPAAGGKPKKLTDGDFDDVEPTWSPDGKHIAFVSSRGRQQDWEFVMDIWVVPAVGGKPRQVTHHVGGAGFPTWSPDGKQLAYVGFDGERIPWIYPHICVQPLTGGEPLCLTAAMDAFPMHTKWAPDGRGVYYVCDEEGAASLWKIGLNGDSARVLPADRVIYGYSVAPRTGRIAFWHAGPDRPAEVSTCAADGRGEKQLSHANRTLMNRLAVGSVESFWTKSFDGTRIQGWMVRPPNFRAGRKYPLILQVHGGPYGAYTGAWKFDAQVLAAQGYVVVYSNPRGSTGYGKRFAAQVTGKWGAEDSKDVLAAMNHVVKQGFIDTGRLGVMGGSYGGFMTTWLIGTYKRFRAAVASCAVTDVEALYYGTDIPYWVEKETGSRPWEEREAYTCMSPTAHAGKVTAATLFLHAEDDKRVPISCSEIMYLMLKRRGVETQFVRYPMGDHGFGGAAPRYTCDVMNRVIDWFGEHLKKK